MKLPEAKSPPALDLEQARVLAYALPKVGKSTLAATANPNALFLDTENGLGHLEVFKQPITSWEEFREAGAELAKADARKRYSTIIVDTADELLRFCTDDVTKKLGIKHPSDLDWGKGWNAVADEWRLRVGKLVSLGYGVWFISHAKDVEIKKPVGTTTKFVPNLTGNPREWLLGLVDYIFYLDVIQGEEGEERVIRTRPSENWEAGTRLPHGAQLEDPLPLRASALRTAIKEALNTGEK